VSRKLLALIGVLTVASALLYVAQPPGHVPPYDAFLNRLAETEREAFCSGWAYIKAASQSESVALAERCRSGDGPIVKVQKLLLTDPRLKEYVPPEYRTFSNEPDMEAVSDAFCFGIKSAGANLDEGQCAVILRTYRLWPTYDPGVSNQWSDRWPYPGDDDSDVLIGEGA